MFHSKKNSYGGFGSFGNQNINEGDYIIPNRYIVSYKLLESYYVLKEKFRIYIMSKIRGGGKANPQLAVDVIGAIVDLHLLLKDYTDITKKIGTFTTFQKTFSQRLSNFDMNLNYNEIEYAVNMLFRAIYECGLTKIQATNIKWDKDLDENY